MNFDEHIVLDCEVDKDLEQRLGPVPEINEMDFGSLINPEAIMAGLGDFMNPLSP